MKGNLRKVTACGLGIALYVALSMTVKIPIAGHASLDLGYIVFAAYCYWYGPVAGMVVGGMGCMLVSLLTSGWFPPGWIAGNLVIGFLVGSVGRQRPAPGWARLAVTASSVILGILVVKTAIECPLYGIPLAVKLPKSAAVAAVDAVVMCFGTWLAPRLPVPGDIKSRPVEAAGKEA